MKIVNDIRSFINDDELKVTIQNNKINILNYKDIGHFDSNKVIVKCDNKKIIIEGKNLVVSKLINDEILINGDYYKIEFR